MNSLPTNPPEWPLEVARLHARLRSGNGAIAPDADRVALWRLLVEALARHLRGYARRAGEPDHGAIEDIAGEKALEMLARAESGAWDVSARSPGEIVRYVANAARNGWLDHAARAGREASVGAEDELEEIATTIPWGADAEDAVVGRELAAALGDCLEGLPERERRVWFFRAYYEMSSRDIAAHPQLRLKPAHVDVVSQRARDALRQCMRGKGHDLAEVPREAFVHLWEVLEGVARGFGAGRAPDVAVRRSP